MEGIKNYYTVTSQVRYMSKHNFRYFKHFKRRSISLLDQQPVRSAVTLNV